MINVSIMKLLNILIIGVLATTFVACNKFLDRPPLTVDNDDDAWVSEEKVRLFANKYYTSFFPGYGENFSSGSVPLQGFTHSDDILYMGNASNFTRAVPPSSIWNYTLIRSTNLMIDRVGNRMAGILTSEQRAHWLGIGRFFRAYRYHQLVSTFGDVPYYNEVVSDTALTQLYKPRDPRNLVMDSVYEDLKFALENVRLNDGDRTLNRYAVAGFITRIALHEGTWQKYYYNNSERARKFLELVVEAGSLVMNSGRYGIENDYRSLFTSEDLKGNRDVLLYRHYDGAVGVTHSIVSESTMQDNRLNGPTTDLLKDYLATDGEVWQNTSVADGNKFDVASMVASRDPRFEATFFDEAQPRNRASYVYVTKFLPRAAEAIITAGGQIPGQYSSSNNTTDYPVMRYAEVLLNWIEAKAELESMGSGSLSQADIDNSINKIRRRPIHPEAAAKGVTRVADLELGVYPNDPDRDPSVSPLIWEIRRERRLEFTFEYSRLDDLKRWSKLAYMDTDANPDLLSGGWVNFQTEVPSALIPANVGLWTVVTLSGQQIVYNGSNAAQMNGFFRHANVDGRQPFLNQFNVNPYLSPIGTNQINQYADKGYVLQQTEGWPQN